MTGTIIASVCLALTAIPTLTFLRNLAHFRRLSPEKGEPAPVSVLIPARNEQAGIEATLRMLLRSEGIEFEILVMDDASDDATAEIVSAMAGEDARIRLCHSADLPSGWNGKQHACWQLSQEATHTQWIFLDADVHLSRDALARMCTEFESRRRDDPTNLGLLSGFPHQQTVTMGEKLLVPLMHFVLLGFLPFWRMQGSKHPAYAAGCGQLFLTDRKSYEQSGGHQAIMSSRHDGIKLPRAYRNAGLGTDIIDATDIATVRMYRSFSETLNGVKKNANEGFARPALIVPVTLFCLAPLVSAVTAIVSVFQLHWLAASLSATAYALALVPRMIAFVKFRQTFLGNLMHVDGLLIFLSIQWTALLDDLRGRRVPWRGRDGR